MRALLLILLTAPAWAGAAPSADDEVLIQPRGECHPAYGDATWKLKGETTMSRVLTALAELDCERFFVPRALLSTKVDIDIGDEKMSTHEMRERVRAALRAKGFELDYVSASRLRRASEDRLYVPPAPPTYSSAPDPELDKGIHCVEHKCTLTQKVVDRMLKSTTSIATSARLVPSFRDGKMNGLKLYAIRPGSFFARLGFQNGDTIHTVNGLDVSSPDKALEVYSKLRGATSVSVAIERRGTPLTLDYIVK